MARGAAITVAMAATVDMVVATAAITVAMATIMGEHPYIWAVTAGGTVAVAGRDAVDRADRVALAAPGMADQEAVVGLAGGRAVVVMAQAVAAMVAGGMVAPVAACGVNAPGRPPCGTGPFPYPWCPVPDSRFMTSTPASMSAMPPMAARSSFCPSTTRHTSVISTVPTPDHMA